MKFAKQIVFILLCTSISLGLLAFNRYYLRDGFNGTIMDFQLGGLLVVIIVALWSLFTLKHRFKLKKFALILFCLILLSEIGLSFQSLKKYQRDEFVKEYSEMDCDQLLERFELDKSRSKFAYFAYGFMPPYTMETEYRKKYGIELVVIGVSCIGSGTEHCYNKALVQHLNEIEDSKDK